MQHYRTLDEPERNVIEINITEDKSEELQKDFVAISDLLKQLDNLAWKHLRSDRDPIKRSEILSRTTNIRYKLLNIKATLEDPKNKQTWRK